MKITVTAEDIASGRRGEPSLCPIATAIRRAIPGSDPWVNYTFVDFYEPARPSARLPFAAQEFISGFDRGFGGHPFDFDLDLEVTS